MHGITAIGKGRCRDSSRHENTGQIVVGTITTTRSAKNRESKSTYQQKKDKWHQQKTNNQQKTSRQQRGVLQRGLSHQVNSCYTAWPLLSSTCSHKKKRVIQHGYIFQNLVKQQSGQPCYQLNECNTYQYGTYSYLKYLQRHRKRYS